MTSSPRPPLEFSNGLCSRQVDNHRTPSWEELQGLGGAEDYGDHDDDDDQTKDRMDGRNKNSGDQQKDQDHEPQEPHEPQQHDQPQAPPQQQQSLQDWLTASALHGTLDVLKLLGGVTLTTTGQLAAPSLRVTRTVLLPQLWTLLVEWVQHVTETTPALQRWNDWFRLLFHTWGQQFVWRTLVQTSSGRQVQQRLLVLGRDVLDCISADTVRQVLVDAMACGIQWATWCATPECEQFVHQLTITACRVVDAAADGRWKRLLHDGTLVWMSWNTFWADPETTVALAEIVAQLCHALEMEQQQQLRHNNSNNINSNSPHERQRRRHERNQYQASTTNARETLQSHRDMTVEEAILSSLGCTPPIASASETIQNHPQQQTQHNNTGGSITKDSVVDNNIINNHSKITATKTAARPAERSNAGSEQSVESAPTDTIRQQQEQQQPQSSTAWHEQVRNGVNVELLRKGIQQRSTTLRRPSCLPEDENEESPRNENNKDKMDDDCSDVEDWHRVITVQHDEDDDDDDEIANNTTVAQVDLRVSTSHWEETTTAKSHKRHRPTLRSSPTIMTSTTADDHKRRTIAFRDEIDPWYQQQQQQLQNDDSLAEPLLGEGSSTSLPLEGESSTDHFHRLLHELLSRKREAAVTDALRQQQQQQHPHEPPPHGIVRRPADNKDDHDRPDSLQKRIRTTAAASRRSSRSSHQQQQQPSHKPNNAETALLAARIQHRLGKEGTKKLVFSIGACLVCVMLIWGALGCYGLFTFWNRYLGAAVVFGASAGPPTTLQQQQPESVSLTPSNRQEIVIRVIKKVVHVDADGRPLGRGPWRREHAPSDNDDDTDTADAQEYQQIAHCVANVYSSSS